MRGRQTPVLVLDATGQTGRRVAARLSARGLPVRPGSRATEPRFDWEAPATWVAAVRGVESAYVAYQPDLAAPHAAGPVGEFAELAVAAGVRRLVLLSGRGEEGALCAEHAVRRSGADWTILRSACLAQIFSEGYLAEPVLSGAVALPVGPVGEPFVDADDVAEVAVAALTEAGHAGRVYELTGPRLLTFAEAVQEVGEAAGRAIAYVRVTPPEYAARLAEHGMPADLSALFSGLFRELMDGRNARLADGVRRALGREPRDFADYARAAAAAGAWREAVTWSDA